MQVPSLTVTALFALALAGGAVFGQEQPDKIEIRISVAEQKLVVLRDGMWVQRFPISTSKFGLGDAFGSYKTPLGHLRVCSKIGGGLPAGAVINHRNATGEVLPANARGRDPIVTRVIWLEGLENGNEHARARGIYIHGTLEEGKIGKPVSYGCIRMRSRDVVELFEALPIGTLVTIQQDKLPSLKRWTAPPPPPMIAAREPVKTEPKPEPKKTEVVKVEPVKVKERVLVAQHVAEKPAPKPEPAKLQRLELPAQQPRLVIRASGAEDHDVRPSSDFGTNAMKGSILFADLPGEKSQRKN